MFLKELIEQLQEIQKTFGDEKEVVFMPAKKEEIEEIDEEGINENVQPVDYVTMTTDWSHIVLSFVEQDSQDIAPYGRIELHEWSDDDEE